MTAAGRGRGLLRRLGPGLLVAATGVGAGDLATAAFTGSQLGVAVLWGVLAGAAMKLALTEGLARWQLATGETVLEGTLTRLGRPAQALFLLYLLPWSWFVGSALISACGVTVLALLPFEVEAQAGKAAAGAACSLAGAVLVLRGGYRLFERIMRVCIALMVVTVVATAAVLAPDLGDLARGVAVPRVPAQPGALGWTVALIGGVGGTLTVLCYGYWLREEGREGLGHLGWCRLDLAVGYAVTALFGMAMVVIGSGVPVGGRGAELLVAIADRLERELGTAVRLTFVIGAFGAVFSSLLGVWQAVPYVFADFWRIVAAGPDARTTGAVDPRSAAYRSYLWALALVPMVGLWLPFRAVQKAYAVVGAAFLPLLALALLLLNGRRGWVGEARNGPLAVAALLATLLFFAWAGWSRITGGG